MDAAWASHQHPTPSKPNPEASTLNGMSSEGLGTRNQSILLLWGVVRFRVEELVGIIRLMAVVGLRVWGRLGAWGLGLGVYLRAVTRSLNYPFLRR